MANRCPKTMVGLAVSSVSAATIWMYGIGVHPEVIVQIEDIIAATPTTSLIEDILPSPAAFNSLLPDGATDFLDHLPSGRYWAEFTLCAILAGSFYKNLQDGRRIAFRDEQITSQASSITGLTKGNLGRSWLISKQKMAKISDNRIIQGLRKKLSAGRRAKEKDTTARARHIELQLASLTTDNVQMAKFINGLEEKNQSLEENNQLLEKKNKELEEKAAKHERKNEEFSDKNAQLHEKNTGFAKTIEGSNASTDGLREQVHTLEANEVIIKASNQMYCETIERQESTVDELQKRDADSAKRIDALNNSGERLRQRVHTLEVNEVSIKALNNTHSETIEHQKKTIDELHKKDGQHKCTVQRYNETIDRLQAEKTAMRITAEKASSRSQSSRAREEEMRSQHSQTVTDLNARISTLEGSLAEAHSRMEQQWETSLEYKADMKQRALSITNLQERIEVAERELSEGGSPEEESQKFDDLKLLHKITEDALNKLRFEAIIKDQQIEALEARGVAMQHDSMERTPTFDELS
ncbi:MAG: hypothetical protein Q9169_006051, partial [Polycauliona sp. 2 TL-2023]